MWGGWGPYSWGGGYGSKGKGKGKSAYEEHDPKPIHRTFTDYLKQMEINPDEPLDLTECINDLWDACQDTKEEDALEIAWAKLKIARKQAAGNPNLDPKTDNATANNILGESDEPQRKGKLHERMANALTVAAETFEEKQERKHKLLTRIFDMCKENKEDYSAEATRILNDAQIRELRVGIFTSFSRWLTGNFPHYFEIDRLYEGKTQFVVRLKDPIASPNIDTEIPVQTYSKKRGLYAVG